MKTGHSRILLVILIALFRGSAWGGKPSSRTLLFEIKPSLAGQPLELDVLTNKNSAAQLISVTRLDFLLSKIALRAYDGQWLEWPNKYAFICGRDGRLHFALEGVPVGTYDRLRFHVGVPEVENHADPSKLAPEHPLHPMVNRLHWSWQGGYVFFALEGEWRTPSGKSSGYSYHIATDRLLMAIELPLNVAAKDDYSISLTLDLDRVLFGLDRQSIVDDTATSHSRAGDVVADRIFKDVPAAFFVAGLRRATAQLAAMQPAGRRIVAATATPYRLRISQFFPQPSLPLDNPLTEEGVELGRKLFHEPLLSVNNSQSCATCHSAKSGLSDPRPVSIGAQGLAGTRNSMPLFNLAWKRSFFWDGRAPSLRKQVLQPIENPIEMHESLTNVVAKLQGGDYKPLFAGVFGAAEISADLIARALEQFLLVQVSFGSKFDKVLNGQAEFSEVEKRGFELFHTEYDPRRGQFGADCFHCHGGPLFQSQDFANNGLDSTVTDRGRMEATGKQSDAAKFAVPSLRNVALTSPYMHDGRFKTLEDVIEHYCTGIKRGPNLDPNLAKHPDGGVPLSEADREALVAFLKTLTDEVFER